MDKQKSNGFLRELVNNTWSIEGALWISTFKSIQFEKNSDYTSFMILGDKTKIELKKDNNIHEELEITIHEKTEIFQIGQENSKSNSSKAKILCEIIGLDLYSMIRIICHLIYKINQEYQVKFSVDYYFK